MTYKEAIEEQKRMVKFRDRHYYGSAFSSPDEREVKQAQTDDRTYICNVH